MGQEPDEEARRSRRSTSGKDREISQRIRLRGRPTRGPSARTRGRHCRTIGSCLAEAEGEGAHGADMKTSHWSWKGSSLDPKFKRPKIRLKRKRDESTSSSGSHSSQRSDDEDLFPEEDQIKYIHRKCPGLLTRHAIKQGKEKVLSLQGESSGSKDPGPVFVRSHRQVFFFRISRARP